jgi:hypothetical protein
MGTETAFTIASALAPIFGWMGNSGAREEEKYARGVRRGGVGMLQNILRQGGPFNPFQSAYSADLALAPMEGEFTADFQRRAGWNPIKARQGWFDLRANSRQNAFMDSYNRNKAGIVDIANALAGYGVR